MNAAITPDKILEILARADKRAPIENIRANLPLVLQALESRGMTSDDCAIAAIATIGVETGSFAPCKERGGSAYLVKLYWTNQAKAVELGNVEEADASRYRGRGFVQITGRKNYRRIGQKIGVDLEANPDLALDPAIAAKILAEYFLENAIDKFAQETRWERVRRLVNGGLNEWAEFMTIVDGVSALIGRQVCVVQG